MRSKTDPVFLDLSAELNDELDWKAGTLRTFDHHLDVTAWAYEPLSHLLAIGTSKGTIDIFGGPGVEHRIHVSDRVHVRSLYFASSCFKLLCIDLQNRLHIWDLTTARAPRLQTIMNFRHPVNCLTVSSSHTHAFVALANGEVQAYDLLCSRLSPYTVPNLWAIHEDKIYAGGLQRHNTSSTIPIDIVIHPRDLNLVFIAYAGGVILLDLTQHKTLKAYEYFLPPGAPGGAGYHDQSLLTERKPELTALAVHPSGHLIATGHVDGSIAFWAVEDKPLLVTTLDGRQDINVVNAEDMDAALSGQQGGIHDQPEPIFKLAWSGFDNSSDPRGGDTVLTVLGGLGQREVPAVTTLLLPPFNPPEPPVQAVPGTTLDPTFRQAIRQTVIPKDMHSYSTVGVPQDFLLLPRVQPHFSGSWDPVTILLLSDGEKDARAIEAYQFPPPLFMPKAEPAKVQNAAEGTTEEAEEDGLEKEIASALESMQIDEDPQSLELPPALWSGPSSVTGGAIFSLDRDAYERFVSDASSRPPAGINLRGGRAWLEDDDGQMKLMKFQPHRVLATHHMDLSVRFRDLSAQLLVSSETAPLLADFPTVLPELTIDLLSVLAAPSIASQTSSKLVEEGHISSIYLATQSLECAVALQTGEIALFRQGEALIQEAVKDQELISTSHLPVVRGRKFHPAFLLITQRGPATACALSDIGFLAAAYQDGSLYVVDMRGPSIVLRRLPEDRESKRRSFLHKNEVDPVRNLTWTVSGTDLDPTPRVLLLVVRQSGSTDIYAMSRSPDGSWSISDQTEHAEGSSNPLPDASFVIDSKNGRRCKADGNGLITAMNPTSDPTKGRYLWITAGTKGARCVVDITGDRLGRVEWPSKAGKVEKVSFVQKNASTVLVAHTDKREALVYSLPFLEHMHGLQLTQSSSEPLSVDDTGDYVEWCRHPNGCIQSEKYGTLFNVRRSGPYQAPDVDLAFGRITAPGQPQPVSMGPPSMLNTFWGYISSTNMTADQVDALLAGPDRPLPKQKQPQRPSMPERAEGEAGSAASGLSAQNIANSASTGVSNLYSRLNNALAERGEMLGNLEDSFANLESGSKNMLAQAKGLAAKQTAKRWFQFS